ncbi:UNVERIFIED_CONTAM: hypothetical protein FKN15_000371 [Acipenser sinensis]
MDRNALAELLQALESRRDAEERRREERYTALIERGDDFWYCDSAPFLDGWLPTDPGMNGQTIQYRALCSGYTEPSLPTSEIVD